MKLPTAAVERKRSQRTGQRELDVARFAANDGLIEPGNDFIRNDRARHVLRGPDELHGRELRGNVQHRRAAVVRQLQIEAGPGLPTENSDTEIGTDDIDCVEALAPDHFTIERLRRYRPVEQCGPVEPESRSIELDRAAVLGRLDRTGYALDPRE